MEQLTGLIVEFRRLTHLSGEAKKAMVLDVLVERYIPASQRELYSGLIDLVFQVVRDKNLVKQLQKRTTSWCPMLK